MSTLQLNLGLVIPALLLCAGVAPADPLAPTHQQRQITGYADASDDYYGLYDSDSDSTSAPGFGLFNDAASAQAEAGDALGAGGGTQLSDITSALISAAGSAFANGEGWSFDAYGFGSGDSTFAVTFTLNQESEVTLDVYMAAYDDGYASVSLESDSSLFNESVYGPSQELTTSYTEMLPAGEYHLSAGASGSAYGDYIYPGYAFAEFNIVLSVAGAPCPGDIDGDGTTDQADLGTLLASYGVDGGGDLDNDGDTDQ
ncbi:MAG: hypothetical protein ACF8NJ_01105, partial [Phycisphaerales bacterium JB038]